MVRLEKMDNLLCLRLPEVLAKQVGLEADSCVEVAVKGQSLVITPVQYESITLEDRLARFDPVRHGGEALVAEQQLGVERQCEQDPTEWAS